MLYPLFRKPESLIFLASIWLLLLCNVGFWYTVVGSSEQPGSSPGFLFMLSIASVALGLTSLLLLLLAHGRAVRLVVALLLVVCSATSFFTARYGILFDHGMMVNVIRTHVDEAFDLLTWPLLINVLLFGLLPAYVVLRYPLAERSLRRAVVERGAALLIALALVLGPLAIQQKEIFSFARNHRDVRHKLAPLNVLSGAWRLVGDAVAQPRVYQFVGLDAVHRLPPAADTLIGGSAAIDPRPIVNVMIVGETARAASFSLGGYARETNPLLKQQPAIDYLEADSCGTATAVSLPCMFSMLGRDDFDRGDSLYQDNLLDIAHRAGYDVYWIDNGNGCQDVCARFNYQDVHNADVEGICPNGECYDEILVHELQKLLPTISKNSLIVLHQLGSHGPAYYKRYPEAFRRFLPDCPSANMADCENSEIVNSYDNTILYTDFIVSSTIDLLQKNSDQFAASLVYMSDHGESLGEHNTFLHGMPYQFAPAEQTRIPLVIWGGKEASRGAIHCSNERRVTHDNLSHTQLGLMGIETSVYQPELDILRACRS